MTAVAKRLIPGMPTAAKGDDLAFFLLIAAAIATGGGYQVGPILGGGATLPDSIEKVKR